MFVRRRKRNAMHARRVRTRRIRGRRRVIVGKSDLVGLFALGSAVTNIVQAVKRKDLAERHEWLKGCVSELKRLYTGTRGRYRAAAAQYGVLRQQNETLWQHVRTLNAAIEELRQHNDRLIRQHEQDATEIMRLRAGRSHLGGARP